MTHGSRFFNAGLAAHSERALRRFALAINCHVFDVRCLDDTTRKCTFNERNMPIDAIARLVPKLRSRNANGSGVFIRPCKPFALADDVPTDTVDRMLDDGLCIAAVIETSPDSHHVWVPLAGPLQTIDQLVCAAACERLVDLYGTDVGVVHRDTIGRAPGFRNRKPEHEHDGEYPLVEMVNRYCGFRGYDRTLLDEAQRAVANRTQPLGRRSRGAVLNARDHTSDSDPEYLGPIEVYANGEHVVTFSAIDTDLLYEQWLTDMLTSGYSLPVRPHGSGTDRSQRDLDVLLSMHAAGVPLGTTQAALEAGSDKALDRGQPYVTHLLTTVWGEP